MQSFPSQSGIAIGPILFVIAILALLAAVISAGFGDFGVAGITDRVSAEVQSQASLIRTKINECNLKYGTANNYDGFPDSGGAPILVKNLDCAGDVSSGLSTNLWSGARATTLPPPTMGFGDWNYINTNAAGMSGTPMGGRCIWIEPNGKNPSSNSGIVQGLTKAASKFTHQTTCSDAASCGQTEVIYDPASASQKFALWISVPTGAPDSNCMP